MLDLVIEHICYFDSLFYRHEKLFVFLLEEDYNVFIEECGSDSLMGTKVMCNFLKDCPNNLAWGSLNYRDANLPKRFFCGHSINNAHDTLVVGIELIDEVLTYVKGALSCE